MKSYWRTAALLSLLLAVGCADRTDTRQTFEENKTAPAAGASAPEGAGGEATPGGEANGREGGQASAREDGAAKRPQATTGARASSSAPRAAAESKPDAAVTETEPETETAAAPGAASGRRAVEWRELTIPAGTTLPLELQTALSSETAQVETPVRATLRQAVVVNGVTAIPIGAVVSGEVTDVERAGRVKGRSRLAFTFTTVNADNMRTSVETKPLTFVGEATRGEDATKIGAGAIGGAIVGGIVGGGDGAAKGAAIGGAAGTGVVLATRGKDVELEHGFDVTATLTAPLTVRVPVR